jgi:hypothetical protein
MNFRFGIILVHGGYDDDSFTCLYSSSLLNFEQGKSGHSAHTSKLFPLTQQVMKEHDGRLSKKRGPAHPGHLDGPTV